MINKKFGELTIIALLPNGKCSCLCTCGNYTIKFLCNLIKGKTKSCGCLRKQTYIFARKDLSGLVFNKLTALYDTNKVNSKLRVWRCLCSCGATIDVTSSNLLGGVVGSCGCINTRDLVGEVFGRLTVKESVGSTLSRNLIYSCLCSCGKITNVSTNHLINGHTRSCGCIRIEMVGINHPSWRGGDKDYCPIWSDKGYKADIRERDSNICQNPYCYGKYTVLDIHHIDYNKKNCHPNNLITICHSCNARANSDRAWHTEWYQAIMSKKYNYRY